MYLGVNTSDKNIMINEIGTVAIIVATYNSESTVIETLESIKEQTYSKIELVITDDASTDNTVAVVKEWLEQYGTRFERYECCVGEVNRGIAANVNRGVRSAKSSFYKLIAADDILFPNAISYFVECLKKDKNCLYISNAELLFEEKCEVGFMEQKKQEMEKLFFQNIKYSRNKNRFLRRMLKGNYIAAVGIGLISKQMYEENHGYDERFPLMEDYPFSLKLLKRKVPFVFINQKLVGYRIHDKSVSHSLENQISYRYEKSKMDFFFKYRYQEMIKQGMFLTCFLQYGYFLKMKRKRNMKGNV